MNEEQVRAIIHQELAGLLKSNRYVFERDIEIADGRNIRFSGNNGGRVGQSASSKIGFYGKTPAIQPPATAHADGTLAGATAQLNLLIDRLQNVGLLG